MKRLGNDHRVENIVDRIYKFIYKYERWVNVVVYRTSSHEIQIRVNDQKMLPRNPLR